MSGLFNEASLVLVPSGYKSGKVYSEVPTDGDGDLTFTRASSATRVNSDGEIEVVGSGVPRLDYSQGSCPALLLEGQRTNLMLYSEDFSNAYWNKQSGITATYNTTETLSPDGTYNATKFVGNGTTGVLKTSISVSGVVSRSVYLKSVTGTTTATFKEPNTNVPSPITLTITNEWQRFEMIGDNGSSFQGLQIDDITSDGIYMWGAQLEAGSYATTYIPTTSATVTRLADDVSLTSAAVSTIAPTSGVTMFIDLYLSQNQRSSRFAVFDNAFSNHIFLGSEDKALNQSLRFDVQGGGVTFLSYAPSFTSVGRHKMAVKFLTSGIKVYLDGVEVASSGANAGFSASFQKIILGRDYPLSAGAFSRSMTNSIMIFPTALSDIQLAELTTL
jgi:hypothetical protein